MDAYSVLDELERAVKDKDFDFYVDTRTAPDPREAFAKLAMTQESVSIIKHLLDICVSQDIQSASNWWNFATYDDETEALVVDRPTVCVNSHCFSIESAVMDGVADVRCHRVGFAELQMALSAGRNDHPPESRYSALGGALLFTGFGGATFRAQMAAAIPELAAAELALDMAARIDSSAPMVGSPAAALSVRRRAGV